MKFLFALLLIQFCTPLLAEDLRTIKFGFLTRLTGDGSVAGANLVKGVKLALKDKEQEVLKDGYVIKPIFEDYGNFDLKKAASGAQKLLNLDKVQVLFPYVSEDVEVVWPLGHRAKVPMIAIRPGGLKVGEFSPHLVRVSSHDKKLYDVLLKHAFEQGYRRLAIISAESSYYTPMTEYSAKVWKDKTDRDPLILEYPITDVNFQAGLLKVKNFKPDLLLTISWNQSYIYRQARELGLDVPFAGVYYHVDEQLRLLPKEVIEGAVYPNYIPATRDFQNKFFEEYGKLPGEVADYAYDAVKMAVHCLQEKDYKPEKMIECILELKDFPGATGSMNFTSDGDRIPRLVKLYRIHNGKFVPLQ